MRLINIENARHSVSAAQLYDELFIRVSLSTYCHQPTCINISYELPTGNRKKSMLVVTSVDVWLQFTFIYSDTSANK